MCRNNQSESIVPLAPGEQNLMTETEPMPQNDDIDDQNLKNGLCSVPIIRLSSYHAIQQAKVWSPEEDGDGDNDDDESSTRGESSSSSSSSSELFLTPETTESLANQIEIQVPGELVSAADDNDDHPTCIFLNPKERNRALLLSATVFKEDKHQKIGVTFAKKGGILKISSIDKEGLLSESPFQPGDVLISINHHCCKKMNRSTFMNLLHSTMGEMTLVVENQSGDPRLVESMVEKRQAHAKTGLGISYRGGRYSRIASVHADKIFSNSLLSRRDYVLSVNGIDCEYVGSTAVAGLVGQAEKYVTVVAERKYESGVVVAMAA